MIRGTQVSPDRIARIGQRHRVGEIRGARAAAEYPAAERQRQFLFRRELLIVRQTQVVRQTIDVVDVQLVADFLGQGFDLDLRTVLLQFLDMTGEQLQRLLTPLPQLRCIHPANC